MAFSPFSFGTPFGLMRRSWLTALIVLPCLALVSARAPGQDQQDDWGEEAEEEAGGRSFLYKELVLSGFYSPSGMAGVPLGDMTRDRLGLSPRPPTNYVGVDFVQTFTSASAINEALLPDWLPLTAVTLHPRLVFDQMESGGGLGQVDFAPQDFWARFNPGNIDRLTLRVGQFVIPYGVNPILAPRQRFILPLEATDLGLKWDWGLDLKGPVGEYDWELAATLGTGEALHSLDFYRGQDSTSYLLTGRIGAPTYWDLQYGFSFLYGDLPMIRASDLLSPVSFSRWRIGFDGFYKYGTYLMSGVQFVYGQDGFKEEGQFMTPTGRTAASVLGYRAWCDWVVPTEQDLRLSAQYESLTRDTTLRNSDDTAIIFEIGYSLTTTTTLTLDIRLEQNSSMGMENDAIFLTLVYYGS